MTAATLVGPTTLDGGDAYYPTSPVTPKTSSSGLTFNTAYGVNTPASSNTIKSLVYSTSRCSKTILIFRIYSHQSLIIDFPIILQLPAGGSGQVLLGLSDGTNVVGWETLRYTGSLSDVKVSLAAYSPTVAAATTGGNGGTTGQVTGDNGLSKGAKAGIGIGVIVGIILLILLLIFAIKKIRARRARKVRNAVVAPVASSATGSRLGSQKLAGSQAGSRTQITGSQRLDGSQERLASRTRVEEREVEDEEAEEY